MFSILKLFKPKTKVVSESPPVPKIQLYNLSQGAYRAYISSVKNNEHETFETARKKMTRNVLLAKKIDFDGIVTTYNYGNLVIKVRAADNTIFWIRNNHYYSSFEIDIEKKNKLNYDLGIEV